jgi:hypothetical protein
MLLSFVTNSMSPIEYDSYWAGVSGKSIEETNRDVASYIQYRNALITSLDPDDPDFVTKLNNIAKSTGMAK